MKKLTLTLSILISLTLKAVCLPVIILFKDDGTGKIVVDHALDNYTLPLTLKFPQALLQVKHTITFYTTTSTGQIHQLVPVTNISQLAADGGFYTLTVAADLTLSPCNAAQGNCKLKPSFNIKIDTQTVPTTIVTGNAVVQVADPAPNAPVVAAATGSYGYPFYDALTLNPMTVATDKGTIQMILQNYGIINQKQLDANPFFKTKFAGLYGGNQLHDLSTAIDPVLNSAGNLDVTNLADGLTKFIVARMKEELSTAFFSRFKTEMETPAGKHLQQLFPTTYAALKTVDKQIYNYSAYLDLLRESFQKDLVLLIPDLNTLINDPDLLAGYPEVKTILSDAAYIANEFNGGSHPGDILNDYVTKKADKTALGVVNPYIYPSAGTLNLLSQSLRSKYGHNYWVSGDSLQMVFASPGAAQMYFGLLYQKLLASPGGDFIFGTKSLKDYLANSATDINALSTVYQPYLASVIEKAKAVDTYFQATKKAASYAKNQPDYQDYYGLVSSSADLLGLLEKCPLPTGVDVLDQATIARIDIYLEGIKGLSGIYVDLYYKQYPAAIMEIGTVMNNTLLNQAINHSATLTADLKAAKGEVDAAAPDAKAALQAKADAIQKQIDDLKDKQKLLDMLTKYGNFVATVAKAQNSDDVQQAIEAIAMPSGSSSVKRNAIFNVALNAYIGPYFGKEKIQDFDKGYTNSIGLTAPVGVALSWGNVFVKGGSLSVFVPLIDLGAIASYRLGNNTVTTGTDTLKTTTIPNIQLKNIVSPGLFLSYGFPNLPISMNVGYQLAPTLRSITVVNNANTVVDPSTSGLANQYASKLYSRFSISFLVDIPLLNFYTRGK